MEGKCNRRAAELAGGEDKGVERGRMWSDVTRDQDGNDETIAWVQEAEDGLYSLRETKAGRRENGLSFVYIASNTC